MSDPQPLTPQVWVIIKRLSAHKELTLVLNGE